jgi:hypothetical protein
MFLLGPDEGLTREELLQKIWRERFTPAHRTWRRTLGARGVAGVMGA